MSDPTSSCLQTLGAALIGVAYLLGYPFLFSLVCQNFYVLFGGFSGRQALDLTTYAYSWFLDSVTFNASQIWSWLPTSIKPTAWWSETLLWLFCAVSDLILFAGLVNMARVIWVVVTRRLDIEQQG